MRDYVKAIEAIQEAEERDTEHKHRGEIQQQELKCQQALFSQRTTETTEETLQRAMRDPEVAVSLFCKRRRAKDSTDLDGFIRAS
jgi:stress-induced-phosphoprotein 1